jgi:hypothetical protein
MSMSGPALGDFVRSSMGFPLPLSTQLNGWGTAVVTHIQTSAIVTHAPGTVTGTAPPNGGALSNGAADNGTISGLSGSVLASLVASDAGYGYVTGRLQTFCDDIVAHIQTYGRVQFATGNIVGSCSNTTGTDGTLTGTGHDGFVKNLNGSILASTIHADVGYPGSVSGRLNEFCTAFVTYIMANAVVTHTNVTAICPAGGGDIIDGQATNGTVA